MIFIMLLEEFLITKFSLPKHSDCTKFTTSTQHFSQRIVTLISEKESN